MPPLPHHYLVALGTNLGDRAQNLDAAIGALDRLAGKVVARAPAYETEPVGAADQLFLNSAALVASELAPAQMLQCLLGIERDMGRVRGVKWGNRVIDLDLLLWRMDGDPAGTTRAFEGLELTVPHPQMLLRDFVLVPACDVAADWRLPGASDNLGEEREKRGYRGRVWVG